MQIESDSRTWGNDFSRVMNKNANSLCYLLFTVLIPTYNAIEKFEVSQILKEVSYA